MILSDEHVPELARHVIKGFHLIHLDHVIVGRSCFDRLALVALLGKLPASARPFFFTSGRAKQRDNAHRRDGEYR